MSPGGTAAYRTRTDLPDLVRDAITAAGDFEYSCHPDQGRLLSLLAAGRRTGVIGETGTGCGVGLAWLASAAGPDTRLVSVELDPHRHATASRLFAGDDRVTVLHGDWTGLAAHGPFDLLVLDGGGSGKTDEPIDPATWLNFGGTLVIDDFTPLSSWPPVLDGDVDEARVHWLTYPALLTTEFQLNAHLATLVARYVTRR